MQRLLALLLSALVTTSTYAQSAREEISDTGSWEAADATVQFHSLEQVLQYADEHAFTIQQAQIGEQISLAEKKVARSYLLPSASASLSFNDNIELQPALVPAQMLNPNAEPGSLEELTFGTRYNYAWSFQAQWDVLNFQKIFALQTAGLNVEASKVNTKLNRYKAYNQLASTYYSVLLTQEAIQIYAENVRLTESILAHAQGKHDQGLISEAAFNTAKLKHLQNQMRLDQATHNLRRFYIQLQSQLNSKEEISVTDTSESFVLTTTEIQSVHPEILKQEAEVRKYEALLKQQKAARLPTLSVLYQHSRNWSTDDFTDFSNLYELPQQAFGIKLGLPVIGLTTRQKIRQSKLSLSLQQRQLENTQLVKRNEDKSLQVEWQQAAGQLAQHKEMLELQEKNDQHAENKYRSEVMSLDARLDQYDDLLTAQDQYLQSLATFTLAQYKIYIRQIAVEQSNY